MLKIKIDKVTVILDLNCPFLAALPCMNYDYYDTRIDPKQHVSDSK